MKNLFFISLTSCFFLGVRPIQAQIILPATGNLKSAAIPLNDSYGVQTKTVYGADGAFTKISFFDGSKKLWIKPIEPGYQIKAQTIIETTGRLFLNFIRPGSEKIIVYSKNGKRLLDIQGRNLAVSSNGRFAAYECRENEDEAQDYKTIGIADIDLHEKKSLRIQEDCSTKAISNDGKYILFFVGAFDLSIGKFALVDIHGKKVWEKAGPYQFGSLENNKKRISLLNPKKKTVEYFDLETGKFLSKVPIELLKFINHNNPAIRSN